VEDLLKLREIFTDKNRSNSKYLRIQLNMSLHIERNIKIFRCWIWQIGILQKIF